MPIIKSAKKRMRQNIKRRARRFPVRSELKSAVKKALEMVANGKTEELVKFLPHVFSVIDTAVKKKILHKNNAAHKKSRIALGLNALQEKGGKKAPAAKAEKVEEAK
ncbi:30S ribosomal protein S20 [Candidatus Gracilibacteria bacterium]|nr:30S ribosomal protein S20 [Candidatus Gracilibacteria bacterium]